MAQVIGKNTLTGAGAAFNLTTPKLLTGTGQQAVIQAGQRIIEAGVAWAASPANGTASGSVRIALYDLATNTLISGTEVVLAYDGSTLQTANVNTHVKQTGLAIDISAHAGKTVGIGVAPPTQSANSGFKVIIETVTGASRNNHSATQATLPATFSIATTIANSAWGAYFVTEDIAPASPSLTGVNSGSGVAAGSTGNIAASTGTWASAVNTGALGGKSVTVTGFNAGTRNITFTMPGYVDGDTYPKPNGTHSVTFTDGTYSPVLAGIPLAPPAGRSAVDVSSPDNADQRKLGYWLALDGKTPVNGDVIIGVDSQVAWLADTGGSTVGPLPLTTEVIFWQASSGRTYFYNVTISAAGEIVSVNSLTSIGLTSIGLTSTGLTSVGL